MAFVILKKEGPVANVILNRPDVRNAFNSELIAELTTVFEKLDQDASVRVVVLSGEGPAFCAGADLNWMKSMVGASQDENEKDALKLAKLLSTLNKLSKPTIAKVHGAAVGGGVGLLSACDVVIAKEGTTFALAEVKLGLIPAVISPLVIAKIGASQARRYFLTGEKFDAPTALWLGLVNEVTLPDDLESRVQNMVKEFLSAGSQAVKECKELIREVSVGLSSGDPQKTESYPAKKLAALRVGPEAQEGMKAFLEKRKPSWNV